MVLFLKRKKSCCRIDYVKMQNIKRKITIDLNGLYFFLRYRCLQCFNFDMCQQCFYMGCTKKKHKLKHPIQEYCLSVSPDTKKNLLSVHVFIFCYIFMKWVSFDWWILSYQIFKDNNKGGYESLSEDIAQ